MFSCAGHTDHKVRAAVDRIVAARLAAAARRQEAGRLPRLAEFDLLRGITGLGALLLRRPETSPLLENVLTYLVSLIHPVADPVLPGWWSPEGPGHEEVTGGHSNNGVAHGISGVLALLALTVRRGIQVAGQLDAIVVFAHWLQRFGGYWITRDQLSSTTQPRMVPGRPSWCYGDLGIARALQLAAIAVGDPASRKAAEQTALAALTDPARMSLITDASLCHGWAGLLTVTRFIAVDSPDPEVFAEPIDRLTGRLATGLGSLPKPGFLEGRAGARLALEGTDSTGWTRALLIT